MFGVGLRVKKNVDFFYYESRNGQLIGTNDMEVLIQRKKYELKEEKNLTENNEAKRLDCQKFKRIKLFVVL